jgi:hypothetical protein
MINIINLTINYNMLKKNKMLYQFPVTSFYSEAVKKSIIQKHETLQCIIQ